MVHTAIDGILTANSGLFRAGARLSARPRPGFQRAFQPKVAAPIISQRFASSDNAREGKIHQVIGAVVDGMFPAPDENPVTRLRENLFLAAIPS